MRDGSEGGLEGGYQTVRIRVVVGGIGMMGRRQATPKWEEDPVQRYVGGGGVREGEGCNP